MRPAITRPTRIRPGALIVLACFVVQAVGVPNLAFARQIPTIQIPKRTVKVVNSIDDKKYNPCDGLNVGNGNVGTQGAGQQNVPQSPAFGPMPRHNSQSGLDSVWGCGWNTDIDQFLGLNADKTLTWNDQRGSALTYFPVSQLPGSPAEYANPVNTHTSLTVTALNQAGEPQTIVQREKDGTTTRYERAGATAKFLLEELKDRNGNPVTYTRDAQGRVTQAVDVHGRTLSFTYGPDGKVSSVADVGFAGRTVTYQYDAAGNKTSEAGPSGTTSYVYDVNHRITEITYPNGGKKTYTYDAEGRVLTESDDNQTNKVIYVYETNRTLATDALNHTTIYEFIEKAGMRRVSKIIDPKNQETLFQYDGDMNLTRQTDPLGRVTQFEVDSQGNVTAVIDPAGKRTAVQYEQIFNQATRVTDPRGSATNLTYDAKGNLAEARDAAGNATTMEYNAIGHVTATHDSLGKITSFGYDAKGALNNVTDPLNRVTAMVRDELGRVTRNTDPKGKTTQFEYDAAGNLTRVTDAMGGVTTYEYVNGRNGKLLSKVVDAERQTSQKGTPFGYDLFDRLASVTNALNQTKTFVYDKKGNLTSITDAKNQTINFTYDELDRMITKTLPEGTISYTYDAAGNLTRVTHYNGSEIQTTYDNLNRVTQVIQKLPNNFTAQIGYGYDDNGNRTSMTTPWGNFSYAYDSLSRLTSITNPESRTITFTYDTLNRRTKMVLPNGIETSYTYDDAGQLTKIEHKRVSDQVVVAKAEYTYDAAGNRSGMVDTTGTSTYEYDGLHQLISAAHPLASHVSIINEAFSYGGVGNRASDAAITGYEYDDANRLVQNSKYTYQFDANGALTSKADRATSAIVSYSFDSQKQLVQALLPDGAHQDNEYDGLGKRVEKAIGPTGNQQVVRYIYDNEDIVAMLDGQNQVVAIFTHGPGVDEPLIMKQGADAYYYAADGLGSIVALTNQAGVVLEQVEYEAYGKPTFIDIRGPPVESDHSFSANPYAFTGRPYDFAVALIDSRLRYRDVETGGFLSEDPASGFVDIPASEHKYLYAFNSPQTHKDPFGLSSVGPGGMGGFDPNDRTYFDWGVKLYRDLTAQGKSPQEILKIIGPMIGGVGFGGVVPATGVGLGTAVLAGTGAFAFGYGIGELINQLLLNRPPSFSFIPDIRSKKKPRACPLPVEG